MANMATSQLWSPVGICEGQERAVEPGRRQEAGFRRRRYVLCTGAPCMSRSTLLSNSVRTVDVTNIGLPL